VEEKDKKIIQKTTEELLKILAIDGSFDVLANEEEETADVILDTKDSGIVIGYHGNMLESLQIILSLCISKRLGKFVRVSMDVGNYRKNRADWLKNLALQIKEKALEQNREIPISNLKPWERRIIHLLLQEDKEVTSESEGEDRDRILIVKPKA